MMTPLAELGLHSVYVFCTAIHDFGLGPDSGSRRLPLNIHCVTRDTISIIPVITINDLYGHAMQIRSRLGPKILCSGHGLKEARALSAETF